MTPGEWAGLLVGVAAIVAGLAVASGVAPKVRNRLLAVVGALVLAAVVVGVEATIASSQASAGGHSPSTSSMPPSASSSTPSTRTTPVQAVIDNRVTDGSGMREDVHPAYLSKQPLILCKTRGCAVPGTDMASGASVKLTCKINGERATNGDDSSPDDDSNPELYTSTLWYGAETPGGQRGYLSEVWLAASFRGGLGLPSC